MKVSVVLDEIIENSIERSRNSPTRLGEDINDLMSEQVSCIPFLNVPVLLKQACYHIVKDGASAFGLFERPNSADKVQEMKDAYEDDGKVRLGLVNVMDMAFLLKEFLFALPAPLLCDDSDDLAASLKQALNDPGEIQGLVNQLPKTNLHTLREFFYTLAVVCRRKYGGMTIENLTLIMGKSEFSFLSTSLSGLERSELFGLMILHFEEIFSESNPLTSEPRTGRPKNVYVDSGKSVPVKITNDTSLDQLKTLVITKGSLENVDHFVFYQVEDHEAIRITDESQLEHPSIFFIPPVDYVQVEFPDIVEEIEDITPVAVEVVSKPTTFEADGENVPYLIWIFQNEKSFRAKDWSTSLSEEAELFIDVVNGEVFCNLISENNPDQVLVVKGANIYQVFDSSRYFIFKEKKNEKFVGVGFYNREESSAFRIDLASKMFEYSV